MRLCTSRRRELFNLSDQLLLADYRYMIPSSAVHVVCLSILHLRMLVMEK
jgi:hypothetical protein